MKKNNKKEISEKTFELNITNQLLNVSKSFLWFVMNSPIGKELSNSQWKSLLFDNVVFSQGLTQDEESKKGGGYDVSIHSKCHISGATRRLMFLQYKSGRRMGYSNKKDSNFKRKGDGRNTSHILFTFNDAAHNKQHGILRELALEQKIEDAVMYVFPRITEYRDFTQKIDNLLFHSSFVPVLEIDKQAADKGLKIIDGQEHKYRTSYDGKTSEVNYFFFFFLYGNEHLIGLLTELICVSIERLFTILNKEQRLTFSLKYFKEEVINGLNNSIILSELGIEWTSKATNSILPKVNSYFEKIQSFNSIPLAPQKYTVVIPLEGVPFNLENRDYSSLNYQII